MLDQVLGHLGGTGTDDVGRQVARRDPQVQGQADGGGADCGQQGVDQGVAEDLAGLLLRAQGGQGRDDGQGDGRHGHELEEPREDGGDEVEQGVQERDVHPAQDAAQDEGRNPQGELPPLTQRVVLLQDGCGRGLYIGLFFRILLVSGIHTPYPSLICFKALPAGGRDGILHLTTRRGCKSIIYREIL